MHELKPYNSKAVIANIELVLKTGDSSKLNKPTYKFISLMSGFIAHYDLHGFQSVYSDTSELAEELLASASICKDSPGIEYETKSYGEPYAKSKHEVYKAIPALVARYSQRLQDKSRDGAREALRNVYNLAGKALKRDDPELIKTIVNKLSLAY